MFKQLRLAEVEDSIARLRKYKPSGELLEIGAGTGWQSRALSDAGYRVEAVDLPPDSAISNHSRAREWPIRDYDGAHLPYPDQTFDIVYSSNVLEHVAELEELMREMKRVLRTDGVALHLLPNTLWRLLSLLTYYPAQILDGAHWLMRRYSMAPPLNEGRPGRPADQTMPSKMLRRLAPRAHGAVGTSLSELVRFSRHSWDDFFARTGWEVVEYGDNGVLASGDYLLGWCLPISARRRLAQIAGGIAHVYLVRPKRC